MNLSKLDCKDGDGAHGKDMAPSEPTEVVPTVKIDEPEELVYFFVLRDSHALVSINRASKF